MKLFASLFAAVFLAAATSASAATPPAAPSALPAKPGIVTFDHAKHPLECTTCHKDDKGGAIEGFNKTVNKEKAHAACLECHKKEAKGPQKCGDCHKKA